MAYVASKLLYGAEITDNSAHTVYTVPLQRRTIMKCIVARSLAAAAQRLSISTKDAGITYTGAYYIYLATAPGAGDSVVTDVWWVMDPGTTLIVAFSNASGGFVTLSGAELEL